MLNKYVLIVIILHVARNDYDGSELCKKAKRRKTLV